MLMVCPGYQEYDSVGELVKDHGMFFQMIRVLLAEVMIFTYPRGLATPV
jgi:hypothetical protein